LPAGPQHFAVAERSTRGTHDDSHPGRACGTIPVFYSSAWTGHLAVDRRRRGETADLAIDERAAPLPRAGRVSDSARRAAWDVEASERLNRGHKDGGEWVRVGVQAVGVEETRRTKTQEREKRVTLGISKVSLEWTMRRREK